MKTKNKNAVGDDAYEYIKGCILSKKILSGEKINEKLIAQELEISRTPVRDAVKRLVNEKLLVLYPNRYVEVARFDAVDIQELGMVRITIDSLAIKLAVHNGSNNDFEALRQIETKCENALWQKDLVAMIHFDCDFHIKIGEISGNRVLMDMQKRLLDRTMLLMLTVVEHEVAMHSLKQHAKIIDALFNRDIENSLRAMRNHLCYFYKIDPNVGLV